MSCIHFAITVFPLDWTIDRVYSSMDSTDMVGVVRSNLPSSTSQVNCHYPRDGSYTQIRKQKRKEDCPYPRQASSRPTVHNSSL